MKKFLIISAILLTSASFAHAEDLLKDPRLKEFQKLIDQMSPEQVADLKSAAKIVEEQLKQLSPSEISDLKQQVLSSKGEIDFESIDVKSIDTSKPTDLKQVKNFFIEIQDAK